MSWRVPLLLLLCPIVAGCGPKQLPISGRVLIDGKPLPGGRVTFRPENPAVNSISAELNEQGLYQVVLPVGKIHVSVDNRELEPRPSTAGFVPNTVPLPPELRSKIGHSPPASPASTPKASSRYIKIPERYYTADSGDLDFTVEPGMQQHDIELSSK
jgi:hypothetical protein